MDKASLTERLVQISRDMDSTMQQIKTFGDVVAQHQANYNGLLGAKREVEGWLSKFGDAIESTCHAVCDVAECESVQAS